MQENLKPLSYFLPIGECGAKGWVKEDLEFYLSDPGYLDNDNKILINDNILYPVPFSFSLISGGSAYYTHPFIIKVLWESNKEKQYAWNGYIEGFGNYKYINSKLNPYTPTEEQLNNLRDFIIKFKVFLTACWWGSYLQVVYKIISGVIYHLMV